ncbi:MAG: cation transporter [Bacteroidetes bacterium]|nr:cation transporter [Bacteroidota bacterium]
MTPGQENVRIQKIVVVVAVTLFIAKLIAWYLTQSVAILTDALESTVNVIAGFIGLYSLRVAAKPRDADHPYGHGKAEFVSAAVEGTLILVAGFIVIYESINNFIHPHDIRQLDKGVYLVAATAIINYAIGYFTIRKGKQNNSLALIASGKHLQSDTYSTLGIIAGLLLILITGYKWLDSVVAIIFALIIVYTGYRIVRSSLAGIMDEADEDLLSGLVELLNSNRRDNWIDLHNLRVIKYGGQLHVDCHLTVPWYINVNEAHLEIDALVALLQHQYGNAIEFFVHTDGCLYSQCALCCKSDCPVRQAAFNQQLEWTLENVSTNKKHIPESIVP